MRKNPHIYILVFLSENRQGKVGGDKSGVQVPPTISNPPTCPLAIDVVIVSCCFTV